MISNLPLGWKIVKAFRHYYIDKQQDKMVKPDFWKQPIKVCEWGAVYKGWRTNIWRYSISDTVLMNNQLFSGPWSLGFRVQHLLLVRHLCAESTCLKTHLLFLWHTHVSDILNLKVKNLNTQMWFTWMAGYTFILFVLWIPRWRFQDEKIWIFWESY